MSVSNQETAYYYVGNGVSVTFAFNCQVPTAADLAVYVDDVPVTSGFTVAGLGNPTGGSITFNTAPANLAAVRIERSIALERNTDYQQNGDFLARVVNVDFNRLWMALQQQASSLKRAILVPKSDNASPAELPKAKDRANKLLGFDANGQPTAYIPESASLASIFLMFASLSGSSMIGYAAAGIGAKLRTLQDRNRDFALITDYQGVVAGGIVNCTDGINNALRNNLTVEIPEGVFMCAPTPSSGDFMLYLGLAGGRSSRNGLTVRGRGPSSVLKLGDNVGRNALLFGAGNGDTIKNMVFRDMTIDLNGLNNLQTDFNDPLRYNAFAYFFCYCENVLFENITFLNASGHQVIRVGDDTGANYGKNIRVKNCRFSNYGIGVPGNKQQDTSALYIQANGIEVIDNTFENDAFTFDPARGHTGIELHGDSSTIIRGNRFRNCQLPWLMASSKKSSENITIADNRYFECFYLGSLDGLYYDQKTVDIGPGNIFRSTKSAAAPLRLGFYAENAKSRENIRFFGNQVILWDNPNQDVHFCDLTNCYVRGLEIFNNKFAGLTGSVVFIQGAIRSSGYMDLSIHDNEMDSLGSTAGVYPNSPTFLHIEHSSGTINTLNFSDNKLNNSALKDYSGLGLVFLSGAINYVTVNNNKNAVNSAYPLVTGTPTTVYKDIDRNFPQTWQDTLYESQFIAIAAGGVKVLADFAGWTANDHAAFRVTVFSTDGGAVNNGMADYDVLICGSGKVATRLANTGVYATDITVQISGTVLQVSNANGNALSVRVSITGNSSRAVNFAV